MAKNTLLSTVKELQKLQLKLVKRDADVTMSIDTSHGGDSVCVFIHFYSNGEHTGRTEYFRFIDYGYTPEEDEEERIEKLAKVTEIINDAVKDKKRRYGRTIG